MQRGKDDYVGKEICILGGGDGALLYELLKENPKHVVMLEIDDLVMQACNKYMNSICGDVLERRQGENYEIIVGDCMVYLNKFIKEGRKFDYVFGDLTDIPISDTPTGEIWDFIRVILESSFKVLKPKGRFMTHGNGASCPESLQMYEDQLNKLTPKVDILNWFFNSIYWFHDFRSNLTKTRPLSPPSWRTGSFTRWKSTSNDSTQCQLTNKLEMQKITLIVHF